jgi:transcriptional regulator NrdR family protein
MKIGPKSFDESVERRGLVCPRCGCGHFRVIYTRRVQGGRIVRRRECRNCGRRITTYERFVF